MASLVRESSSRHSFRVDEKDAVACYPCGVRWLQGLQGAPGRRRENCALITAMADLPKENSEKLPKPSGVGPFHVNGWSLAVLMDRIYIYIYSYIYIYMYIMYT